MCVFCGIQVKLREMKPGMLSQELKEALGMPEGAPPPWLINMQVIILNILRLVEFVCVCYHFYILLTVDFLPEIWSSTILPTSENSWA